MASLARPRPGGGDVTVGIRTAVSSDAPTIARIAAETFPLACPPDLSADDVAAFVAQNLSEERFGDYLADPARMLLLASTENGPAGFSMLHFEQSVDADVQAVITARPTVELSKFFVLADQHGSGLAAELMSATVLAAASGGARGVWLGVSRDNARANRFYEKHGFRLRGTKGFTVGTRFFENDFVLERLL